jgi:hypothetical protein
LDLDGHLLAGHQPRPVHLRDGCGGHRVQVELGEDLLTTKHQFGGEEILDGLGRRLGDLILQPGEFGRNLNGQQIDFVASSWPSLTKVPPASSSVALRARPTRRARGCPERPSLWVRSGISSPPERRSRPFCAAIS